MQFSYNLWHWMHRIAIYCINKLIITWLTLVISYHGIKLHAVRIIIIYRKYLIKSDIDVHSWYIICFVLKRDHIVFVKLKIQTTLRTRDTWLVTTHKRKTIVQVLYDRISLYTRFPWQKACCMTCSQRQLRQPSLLKLVSFVDVIYECKIACFYVIKECKIACLSIHSSRVHFHL